MQVAFPRPVRLSHVDIELDLPNSSGSASTEVFVFVTNLSSASSGRLRALSSTGVPVAVGRSQRVNAGEVLTDGLVVRGVFRALTIHAIGAQAARQSVLISC
jgi:hypothetical protein